MLEEVVKFPLALVWLPPDLVHPMNQGPGLQSAVEGGWRFGLLVSDVSGRLVGYQQTHLQSQQLHLPPPSSLNHNMRANQLTPLRNACSVVIWWSFMSLL